MALPLPKGASLTPPPLPKGASLTAPEEGNLYTQEEVVYSPEGIPLYTSSYGSANPYKGTEKALTTAVSLPVNVATGAAKPIAGIQQALSKLVGSNRGDEMVNAINQIEAGTQAQAGDVGGAILKIGRAHV